MCESQCQILRVYMVWTLIELGIKLLIKLLTQEVNKAKVGIKLLIQEKSQK